jgi:sulfite reductase (NADPH) flavoprotein alpha-component
MLRKILLHGHRWLGLAAGLVLALVGLSGAVLSFEQEILHALNPQVFALSHAEARPLSPPQLAAQIRARYPQRPLLGLQWFAAPAWAPSAGFGEPATEGREGGAKPNRPRVEWVHADPRSGVLLVDDDHLRGHETIAWIEDLHRRLAAGDTGKAITGACALILAGMTLSGLTLRWPARPGQWRSWFQLKLRRRGRALWWHLHATIGTWLLPLYLIAALTGLYWSYDWYKDGLHALTATPKPRRDAPRLETPFDGETDLQAVWNAFQQAVGPVRTASINLPQRPDEAVDIRYLDADPAHPYASSRIALHPRSGAVLSHERFADKSFAGQLMSSLFALHGGSWLGWPGRIAMMLAALLMPLFAITGWVLFLGRQRARTRATRAVQEASEPTAADAVPGATSGF